MSDVVGCDRVPPTSGQVHATEPSKQSSVPRRIRVNNNNRSSVFTTDPDLNDSKTVKRCSYHKNLNSYDDIFGKIPVTYPEHLTTGRSRMTPSANTERNLFGSRNGSPPPPPVLSIRVVPSAHADTFDSLFGTPELTQNQRRPYEEDTHSKIFGGTQAVHRRVQSPQDNTQTHIFGPPIAFTPPHSTSRTENTQRDIFGPPLPSRKAVQRAVRSSLQLFTDAVDPPKPVTHRRPGKANDESYKKLFGAPHVQPLVPRPPPEADTGMRLFGPTIARPSRPSQTRVNPITWKTDDEASTTPSPPAPPKPLSTAASPITGLTMDGSPAEEEKVSRKKRFPPAYVTKFNTITGARSEHVDDDDYDDQTTSLEMEVEKTEKETPVEVSSETETVEKSSDDDDSTGDRVEQSDQGADNPTSSSLTEDTNS